MPIYIHSSVIYIYTQFSNVKYGFDHLIPTWQVGCTSKYRLRLNILHDHVRFSKGNSLMG